MNQENPSVKSPFIPFAASLFSKRLIASMLSIIMLFALGSLSEQEEFASFLIILCGIFGFLYLLYSVYRKAERTGMRDYNLVKYKHIKEDLRKGLRAGLAAEVPVLLFLIVTLSLFAFPAVYTALCTVLSFLNFHCAWLQMLTKSPWVYLALSPILPALGWIGYRNGYRQIDIFSKIFYRNKNSKSAQNSRR